jgi:hypothetical protein
MKKLSIKIIVFGIITEVALLIFFDKKIAAYGPVIFWAIALFEILNYGANIFKLSASVKKRNPELYKRHSFGIMITRNALSDEKFLAALNEEELIIIENNKTIFKYLFLCFGLFAISAILIVLK